MPRLGSNVLSFLLLSPSLSFPPVVSTIALGRYYFSRYNASLLFFDELRRNTEEEDVDVRRANMDRFSAVFQHVHGSTLPRLHWGMLARYASSKVETEGNGNGENSFGNLLHVNGEQVSPLSFSASLSSPGFSLASDRASARIRVLQVMESWETPWMRKLAKFGLSKVHTTR